ncbi:MAG: hypothetical protein SF029_02620 [bacterium]|nr:hypothetical protein [bacterium]
MRWLLVPLLLLLTLSIVHAQDAPVDTSAFRLRQPSADEYVNRLLENGSNTPSAYLLNILLLRRFPDLYQVDPQALMRFYEQHDDEITFRRPTLDAWNTVIVHALLYHNAIDLSAARRLRFADYAIEIIPRDYDGDGENEYLLEVVKGADVTSPQNECGVFSEYEHLLVVDQEGSDYHFIETPLIGTPAWSYPSSGYSEIVELAFEDLNDDQRPEWILVEGSTAEYSASLPSYFYGRLHVLGWEDGQIVSLIAGDIVGQGTSYAEDFGCQTPPASVRWEFTNVDADPAREIVQQQLYIDNWHCDMRVSETFDWDTEQQRFVRAEETRTLSNTLDCTHRLAEEAMWEGDYERAVTLYELAETLPKFSYAMLTDFPALLDDYTPRANFNSIEQYRKVRMALGYLLTGNPDRAAQILDDLNQRELSSDMMQFVAILEEHSDTPLLVCVKAFEYASVQTIGGAYPYGTVVDQFSPFIPYHPDRIACDAERAVTQMLAGTRFSTNRSPVEQLEEIGLGVRETITADFNDDGTDEWLVWLDAQITPIFFAADGETYHISRPDIDRYRYSEDLRLWQLPDNAGLAVAYTGDSEFLNIPPWAYFYRFPNGDRGGGPGGCLQRTRYPFQRLWMWRMEGDELIQFFRDTVCRSTVEELFPEGEGSAILDAGQYEDGSYGQPRLIDLIYTWDSTTKAFVLLPTSVATREAPEPTVLPSISQPQPRYSYAPYAFEMEDYAAYIELSVAEMAAYDTTEEAESLAYTRYYRAFAFEQLGDDDAALREYVWLYQNAPSEDWRALAELHLEHVEG